MAFQGRPVHHRHSEVRALRPGDLVRFHHGGKSGVAGTIINHSRSKKGVYRSLVHVHSTGEFHQVEHRYVTHVKKVARVRDRMLHLRLASTIAEGHRADTQSLGAHEPARLLAAARARELDEALRTHGLHVPERDRAGGKLERDHPESPQPRYDPTLRPTDHMGELVGASPRRTPEGDPYAHPKHLRAGDEIRYYREDAGRGLEAQGGRLRLSGSAGVGRRGVVMSHGSGNVLHAYNVDERREDLVPYSRIHHVQHSPRSERENTVRNQVGGKHRAPLLAAVKADRSKHRRLVHDDGAPAFFRSPTYQRNRMGHYPHGASVYPSAPGDAIGSEVHEEGGVEPFWEMTDPAGEFREAALQEAESQWTKPQLKHLEPSKRGYRAYRLVGEHPQAKFKGHMVMQSTFGGTRFRVDRKGNAFHMKEPGKNWKHSVARKGITGDDAYSWSVGDKTSGGWIHGLSRGEVDYHRRRIEERHGHIVEAAFLERYGEWLGPQRYEHMHPSRRQGTVRCPHCGHLGMPGAKRCSACGSIIKHDKSDHPVDAHGLHMMDELPEGHPFRDMRKPIREAALTEAAGHTTAMVALYPPPDVARKLAIRGGEKPEEMHVTLAFLGGKGDFAQRGVDERRLRDVVRGWAAATPSMRGRVGGLGVFPVSKNSDGKPVTYAPVNVPHLETHRHGLVTALAGVGAPASTDHGFTPHLTLAYGDRRNVDPPDEPVHFQHATLKIGDKRYDFPLRGRA